LEHGTSWRELLELLDVKEPDILRKTYENVIPQNRHQDYPPEILDRQHNFVDGIRRLLTRFPDTILPNHSVLHAGFEPKMSVDEDILLPNANIDALDVDIGRVGIEGLPMEPALLRVRGNEGFFDGQSGSGIRARR
jgi:hypothetical protein